VIALLVGIGSLSLLRQSMGLAMDAVPASIDPEAVRRHLLALPGARDVHDLHVWGLGTSGVALTAHLVMPDGHSGDAFLRGVGDSLRERFGIGHSTLQIEFGDEDCAQGCAPHR
jgi:cobalt-zinc-cadmium efflux system protein